MLFKIKLIGLFVAIMLFSAGVFAEDWSKKSFEDIKAAAERGNSDAQVKLGVIYYEGDVVAQDIEQTIKWFTKAAVQGNIDAQFELGIWCENGTHLKQSYAEALKWYRLAADQGHAASQRSLGRIYEDGIGVAQNFNEAMKWNRLAAQQGDAYTQYRLGLAYRWGVEMGGLSVNIAQAYIWMSVAAFTANGSRYSYLLKDILGSRDKYAKELSPSLLIKAQQQSQRCIDSGYQDCDL